MKWMIYKHTNSVNGKVYIGQTRKLPTERWRNGKAYTYNPSTRFAQAIMKYGWNAFKHEIIESDIDSQQLANERERFWISQYDAYSFEFGYNMTLGGTDIPFHVFEKALESKRKKKIACFNMIFCWELAKLFPNPTIALEWFVNNGHKNNYKHTNPILRVLDKENRTCFGFHFCRLFKMLSFMPVKKEETNKNKGKRKKIICINTGDLYDSLSNCGRVLGIKTQHLSKACKNHSPTHNLYFAYLEDFNKETWEKHKYDNHTCEKGKAVYCFELKRNWRSITSCCNELGISTSQLSRLLSNQDKNNIYKTVQGKHFCFYSEKDSSKIGKHPSRKDSRAVYCVETKNRYDTIGEAERTLNIHNVLKCCNNWKYTSGGYHWCFFKDKESFFATEQATISQRNRSKRVKCLETGIVFSSKSEACRFIHRDVSSLSEAIKNKRLCGGYHWECLD